MSTIQVLVNGKVVSEVASEFGNKAMDEEVGDSIRRKNRKAYKQSSRDRRKKKSDE